jgi:hypothetical protein
MSLPGLSLGARPESDMAERSAPRGKVSPARSEPATEVEGDLATRVEPPWVTLLWNCDCHTFDEVARQLTLAIGCSWDRGMAIARIVHHEGKALVQAGPRAECERVAGVLAAIGLRVTVVPA